MTDYAKLRVAELKVLKREEESLHVILSKYRNSLNALKVWLLWNIDTSITTHSSTF